jgi:hypothetical protein
VQDSQIRPDGGCRCHSKLCTDGTGLDDGVAIDGKFLDIAFRNCPGRVNYATVLDSGHEESSSDALPALG